jgi:hypothetical protein
VTDGVADGFDGPFLSLPQPVLELGEELLDGIEIRLVLRQEEEPCAGSTNGAAHGLALV